MVKSKAVKPSTTSSTTKSPTKPATTTTPKKNTPLPANTASTLTSDPPVKVPPTPLEVKPVKPVKEAAKAIDTQVMKEVKEKEAQKDAVNALKANGNNPAPKGTSYPIPTAKKDEKDVKFAWTPKGADKVQITGSFNNWKEKLDMKHVGDKHELSIPLKPGKYTYKFIVDGEWCYDFTAPNESDPDGNVNNIITV